MRAGAHRRIVALRVRDHIGVRTALALVLAFGTAGCEDDGSIRYHVNGAYLPPYLPSAIVALSRAGKPRVSGPTRC